MIARFSQLDLLTGKEFAAHYKKIVENLVGDLEQRRRSRRHGGEHAAKSLESDSEVARLALLIADGRASAESRAIEHELRATVQKLLKRLTPRERLVARLVMLGLSERQIIEQVGPAARGELRSVASRLRRWLAAVASEGNLITSRSLDVSAVARHRRQHAAERGQDDDQAYSRA